MNTVTDETACRITLTSQRKCLLHNTYSTVSLIYVLRHILGVDVCELARKKTANSMRSIMAFSSILSFGPVIRFLQACPDPRSCLSPNSPFVTKAESSPAILYYRTTTFKYFVFFFSQIAGFPCASPILFFLLSLYTPPPPATPSVYRKFTLPVSTNPSEHPEEKKRSRKVYCCSHP